MVDPYQFEDVASSVLRPDGWLMKKTARTRDGGMDAIFEGPSGELACLEAKRWGRKVTVKEIRAFCGVLVDNGIVRGLFASASEVTQPARDFAERSLKRVNRIELYDGPRFLEALRLRQEPVYRSYEHWRETVGAMELHYIEREGPTYLP